LETKDLRFPVDILAGNSFIARMTENTHQK
jgi:hypothetical protein